MIKVLKYDPYLQTIDFINWLESMANEGWFISGLNQDSIWVKFCKDEPKKVRYTIYAIENSKLFNKDEFFEIAEDMGWILVGESKYLRELYLFVNELEDPLPLETDPIEQVNKNQNLKRLAIWSIGFSVILIIIWCVQGVNNSSHWIPTIGYAYIALLHVIQALRTAYASHPSRDKRHRVVRLILRLRVAMLSSMVMILIGLGLNLAHTSQKTIDSNPLVAWNLPTNAKLLNESYTTSILEFMPNYTSFVTVFEEGKLTRSIYQTKQSYLLLSKNEFKRLIDRGIDWFNYDNALKFSTIRSTSNERVLLESKNKREFWSFVKKGNTLLTLHTINLTQEEHQALLSEMEVSA